MAKTVYCWGHSVFDLLKSKWILLPVELQIIESTKTLLCQQAFQCLEALYLNFTLWAVRSDDNSNKKLYGSKETFCVVFSSPMQQM